MNLSGFTAKTTRTLKCNVFRLWGGAREGRQSFRRTPRSLAALTRFGSSSGFRHKFLKQQHSNPSCQHLKKSAREPLVEKTRMFSSENTAEVGSGYKQLGAKGGEDGRVLRVLFIRHAESENNRLYRELCSSGRQDFWDYDRYSDPPLTEEGWIQAEDLATRLEQNPQLYDFAGRKTGIKSLYTSAMYRALQTTSPVYRRMKIPTEVWPGIHETGGVFHMNEGVLRGLTRDQILVEFSGYHIAKSSGVSSNGWWRGGVETYDQMIERAVSSKKVLVDMASQLEEDTTVAVISHGSFLSALIRSLTQANCSFALLNTSISCIDIQVSTVEEGDDDYVRVRLHYLNSVSY
mmetsp:Transcript_21677/g.30378  ORF Transcript_21677/g.30378 Transcript_21677/m.30378 type:complete len:348 (-) Transcript_21677:212-1255(-)